MTVIHDPGLRGDAATEEGRWLEPGESASQNVGDTERAVSVAAGAILAALGLARGTGPGLLLAGLGGALVYRGVSGTCPVYGAMGLNTAEPESGIQSWANGAGTARGSRRVERRVERRGIHIEQALQVNKPADELYAYWRNFENLPRIMSYLEGVRVEDENRSHWVARAPRLAGGSVEWDAEITADEPGQRIAWRSLPGSEIDTVGEVRFEPALGDRGTVVHVTMRYVPPAGRLGHWLSSLMGENPERVIREDLRRFKRTMELGEVLTVEGQPHGTCTGQGKPYRESRWKPHFS